MHVLPCRRGSNVGRVSVITILCSSQHRSRSLIHDGVSDGASDLILYFPSRPESPSSIRICSHVAFRRSPVMEGCIVSDSRMSRCWRFWWCQGCIMPSPQYSRGAYTTVLGKVRMYPIFGSAAISIGDMMKSHCDLVSVVAGIGYSIVFIIVV